MNLDVWVDGHFISVFSLLTLQNQWRRKYHLMTIKHQFVNQMASNKASPTSHENAFPILVRPELDLWITACLGRITQILYIYIL